jgi:hypothetical protein
MTNRISTKLTLVFSQVTDQKIRMALLIVGLTMFLLGAGAPEDSGGLFR